MSSSDAPYPLVELGDQSFPLIPQPVGTLTRRLQRYAEPIYAALEKGEIDVDETTTLDSFVRGGLGKVYALLLIFYPQMSREPVGGGQPPMPFWKFDGWASATAFEQKLEDEDGDGGPTVPQIKAAIIAGLKANELDTIAELRDAVPFDSLKEGCRRWIKLQMVRKLEAMEASPSPGSSSAS